MEFAIFIILVCLYFVPTFIAHETKHPHFRGILALNILLGWTFLFWALAIVWALMKPATSADARV